MQSSVYPCVYLYNIHERQFLYCTMRAHVVHPEFDSNTDTTHRIQASWSITTWVFIYRGLRLSCLALEYFICRLKRDMEDIIRPDSPILKLSALQEREENTRCADCNEPDPTWASTNWGVFICTQCAGVHRWENNLSRYYAVVKMGAKLWAIR